MQLGGKLIILLHIYINITVCFYHTEAIVVFHKPNINIDICPSKRAFC